MKHPAAPLPLSAAPLIDALARLMRDVAATELMPRFRKVAVERKHDGSVVTEADRAVEAALVAALPGLYAVPVLGEEMPPDLQRALWRGAEWCWCVDPLDGTGNFAHGKRYFGISVALLHRRLPVLGAVYDPNTDEFFSAARGGGAYARANGQVRRMKPAATVPLAEARVEVGRFKRLGRVTQALFHHAPFAKLAMSGASVLQWCHLADGRFDAFLHAGEQPWDFAAGALIAEEAGARMATLMHDDYWRCDPVADWERSVIAARHPALFEEWKRWVRAHL
ncbi:MAG: inositol monophosphatase family protein [Betaproteobacteria bacterium]|nr:inositol monophosphatase family protein [Betaproteobacteria bacterium]